MKSLCLGDIKRTFIFILLIIGSKTCAFSQVYGTSEVSKSSELAFNSSGEKFLIGCSDNQLLLLKLNQGNSIIQAHKITENLGFQERVPSLAIDSEDNFIITGTQIGNSNGLILKLSTDYSVLWSQVCNQNQTFINKCAVDDMDNIYICGTSNVTTNGGSDSYISSFNADGEYLWSSVVGGRNDEHFTDIKFFDTIIEVYGSTKSIGLTGRNALWSTYNYEGEVISHKTHSLDFNEIYNRVYLDSFQNRWKVGFIQIDGVYQTLLTKSSSDQNFLWSISFGLENYNCRGGSIVSYGEYFYLSSRVFDSDEHWIMLTKIDSEGNVIWSKRNNFMADFEPWAGTPVFNTFTQRFEVPCVFSTAQSMGLCNISLFDEPIECEELIEHQIISRELITDFHSLEENSISYTLFNELYVESISLDFFTEDHLCEETSLNLMENQFLNSTITIYPNPTYDKIYIDVKGDLILDSYQLVDQSGRVVDQNYLSADTQKIELSAFETGVYFIRIYNATGDLLVNKRVVKL